MFLKFRKAAEQGDAGAQFNLALCYYLGLGVDKDPKAAAAWCRKAAEQGYAVAQFNLGLHYDHGQGVEKDPKAAAAWYRKAAEQGNAKALNALQKRQRAAVDGGRREGKGEFWQSQNASLRLAELAATEASAGTKDSSAKVCVGEHVFCRDDGQTFWHEGTVVDCAERVKVRIDGWAGAPVYPWDHAVPVSREGSLPQECDYSVLRWPVREELLGRVPIERRRHYIMLRDSYYAASNCLGATREKRLRLLAEAKRALFHEFGPSAAEISRLRAALEREMTERGLVMYLKEEELSRAQKRAGDADALKNRRFLHGEKRQRLAEAGVKGVRFTTSKFVLGDDDAENPELGGSGSSAAALKSAEVER